MKNLILTLAILLLATASYAKQDPFSQPQDEGQFQLEVECGLTVHAVDDNVFLGRIVAGTESSPLTMIDNESDRLTFIITGASYSNGDGMTYTLDVDVQDWENGKGETGSITTKESEIKVYQEGGDVITIPNPPVTGTTIQNVRLGDNGSENAVCNGEAVLEYIINKISADSYATPGPYIFRVTVTVNPQM